ncbi:hypothetical protein [Rheinheimera soli]|uniref:hypothetical protein n=1 Tax=Rheinheimera soli TaxID=443616 RepID=UPI001E344F69|nr:hypothetical protein [Rheinheimera soli]
MTASEFSIIFVWLLALPSALGFGGLALVYRRFRSKRTNYALACAILVPLSGLIAFAIVAYCPDSIGRYIGIKDTPIMWAPFAFISVATAFPFVAFWLMRTSAK